MPSLKELREQGTKLADEIREMGELYSKQENRWQDDQEAKWDDLNQRYDETIANIETEKQSENVANRLNLINESEQRGENQTAGSRIPGFGANRGGGSIHERDSGQLQEAERCELLASWCRSQMGDEITERQQELCQRAKFSPNSRCFEVPLLSTERYQKLQRSYGSFHPSKVRASLEAETRAMSAFTAGSGGALVPASFLLNLEMNMLAFGGLRQVADLMVTDSGSPMAWPGVDDTSNSGEQIGENTSVGASVDPVTKQLIWNSYKFSSKPVLVPFELLRDNPFNLVQILSELLGERLGRITSSKFTNGSGAGTPHGIMLAAALGVTAAGAAAITADEVMDLQHSVDPAYRNGAGFMAHDTVVKYLRKLKDNEGRYLWSSGLRDNVPDSLAGSNLTINQDMPSSIATGNKTLLFGQFSKYKIRRVGTLRMYRMQERYRDQDQDGFVAFLEEDGRLLNMGTAPVKYLQQA